MSVYQYVALKKSGQSTKGTLEADSERHARDLLREQGLFPTEVQSLKKSTYIKKKHKLGADDLCLLTRQLATLLSAGIPIEESLNGVAEQSEKEANRALIIGVRGKVMEGFSLAQALGEYPKAFPELYRATVAAGEQSGQLDQVLEKLADYTENQQGIRQKIQQALIYPSLMIIISISIISFLLTFVVPKIIDVFTSSGQSLPLATKILIHMSNAIEAYGLYAIIILVVLLIIFFKSLKNPTFRTRWDGWLLQMPVVRYLVRATNVARYIHTFGILFGSGVQVLETLKVSAHLVHNSVLKASFEKAAIKIKEGTGISKALKETTYLSPMAIHLIASGEKSGQLAPMMERAARHLDTEVKHLIDTALTLLEPLVILLMGAVVLFIVLATLLPIFSMEQLVN